MKLIVRFPLILLLALPFPALSKQAGESLEALPGTRFFSGKNDFLIVARNHGILAGASEATLAAWVKPAAPMAATQHLVSVSIGGGSATWHSRAAFGIAEGGVVTAFGRAEDSYKGAQEVKTSAGTVKTGQWQHIAVVFDYAHSNIRIFVNGRLVPTGGINSPFPNPVTPATPSDTISLGAEDDGSNFFFHGSLAQAKIWNRALGETEIRELAAKAPPG